MIHEPGDFFSKHRIMTDQPHILVVDDDDRLRELLREYLTENGFRVTTAEHAEDARARLRGLEFDLGDRYYDAGRGWYGANRIPARDFKRSDPSTYSDGRT